MALVVPCLLRDPQGKNHHGFDRKVVLTGGVERSEHCAMASAGMAACPDCGVSNAADHNYCKHCGRPLRVVPLEQDLASNPMEQARERCLKLVDAYPDNAQAHFNLGLAYYHLGQVGNAIRAFERAIRLDDAMPATHFQLALCHYRRGAMAECVTASRRAIQLNPASAPAHFRLAIALFHLGRLEEAADAFEATLGADAEYVIAWYHLGVIRERQDDADRAAECFERVVEANPDDASAHYHLGIAYERRGLESLAMSALARALELDPSDEAAATALQELQR
jgi:tetratricopeptide (TPR) repeat protein